MLKFDQERLIFVLSLPRSGSTLFQRILGNYDDFSTTSEFSVMLPLLYLRYRKEMYASYNIQVCSKGFEDFVRSFPDGWSAYDRHLTDFILNLYGESKQKGASFVVDKTPRYSLIVPELIKLFPRARYVFLWRNPAQILDSSIKSLWGGKWLPSRLKVDLELGLKNLVAAADSLGDRAHHIRYNELVEDTDLVIKGFANLIGVDTNNLKEIKKLPGRSGRLGDPSVSGNSDTVFTTSAVKENEYLCSSWRKKWLLKRLKPLPDTYWDYLGIDFEKMEADILDIKESIYHNILDLVYNGISWADDIFDLSIRKERFCNQDRYMCR